MRKVIFIALGVIAATMLIFAVVVALQPADFRVVRTATINAPPAEVFPHVNDFHNWEAWSPWAKLDPAAKNTFEGPSAGKDAIFKWSGNDKVGEGQMTILESHPNDRIKIKLEFKRPFESTCSTDFTFKGVGEQTEVIWDMNGQNNFMGKAFCLFMDMDKTVGKDFEKGLENLKDAVKAKKQENK
jgi:uncharacterized protein YndB with AHSA1/START domain